MASTYINRTVTSAGNQKTFTVSYWLKRSRITSASDYIFCYGTENVAGSPRGYIAILNTTDTFAIGFNPTGSQWYEKYSVPYYRDVNGWYHLVWSIDTTQSSEANRVKLYVNGSQVSLTGDTISQNFDTGYNSTTMHELGSYPAGRANGYLDGLLAHFHFIDGTAYDASTFGETDANGVWTPKTSPSVTYGTNGFFLKFENSGSMGTDSSPNGNNFTGSGGNLTQTVDSPSNVFATLNPNLNYPSGMTFQNGNTTLTCSGSQWQGSATTLAVNKGKWYFEAKYNTGSNIRLDIGRADADLIHMRNVNDSYLSYRATGYGYQLNNSGSDYYVTGNVASVWNGSRGNSTKIIMVAVDLDNGKLWYGDNGTWYNTSGTANPATGDDPRHSFSGSLNGEFWFFGMSVEGTSAFHHSNFGNGYFGTTAVTSGVADGAGQGIFEYTPPAGYYALCTKNINTYG